MNISSRCSGPACASSFSIHDSLTGSFSGHLSRRATSSAGRAGRKTIKVTGDQPVPFGQHFVPPKDQEAHGGVTGEQAGGCPVRHTGTGAAASSPARGRGAPDPEADRKSTRLN